MAAIAFCRVTVPWFTSRWMCSGHYSTKCNGLKEKDKGLKWRKCTSTTLQYLAIASSASWPCPWTQSKEAKLSEIFLTVQFVRLTNSWHDLRQYGLHWFYDRYLKHYSFILLMVMFFRNSLPLFLLVLALAWAFSSSVYQLSYIPYPLQTYRRAWISFSAWFFSLILKVL